MAIQQPNLQTKNPAELLQDQTRLLSQISEAQNEQIRLLKTQNEQIVYAASQRPAPANTAGIGLARVNLADVSIPFWTLVGLFMKMWLASLFATLILGVVIGGLFLILSFILTVIGIGLLQ